MCLWFHELLCIIFCIEICFFVSECFRVHNFSKQNVEPVLFVEAGNICHAIESLEINFLCLRGEDNKYQREDLYFFEPNIDKLEIYVFSCEDIQNLFLSFFCLPLPGWQN